MANNTNNLGTESVKKLLIRLATPAILAQMVNALYNIVDRIYIGNMPNAGHLALTGVGLTFPIIMLISAFSALVGIGGGPLLSIALGENDKQKAHKILGTCFTSLIVLAGILTTVFLIYKEPFLYMFGASDDTFPYANEYISYYLFGTIFVTLSLGLNPFINAQGFSKIAMATVVIGAIANIVLDPILIFGFDLGVKGAAIATVISQAISALWILKFLFSKKSTIKIKPKYIRINPSILGKVLSLGVSPFIMQSTESLVMISLNYQLAKYGNDFYVGSMTIISSIAQMIFMPIQGLMQGAQPIMSFNYGAGQLDRVRQTFKLAFKYSAGFAVFIWAALLIFPQIFISIFNSDPSLLQTAVPALRIHMSMIFCLGLQTACQQTFLALGQAKVSVFLASLRKIILLVPLTFILPVFFGVDGIFFAEPISDFLAASTTLILFTLFYKKHLSVNKKDNLVENRATDDVNEEK